MADEDLQALRRAARAGDPAARPALVRALLRAGRPASDAWDDDALGARPGLASALEVLAPEAQDAFAADVGWLDPARLLRHLRDDPSARRLLAVYPGREGLRWLRVERTRPTGPWRLDLAPAPDRVPAGGDARLLRHRWDARCEALELALPFGVPAIRFALLTTQLFRRLGVTFQPRTAHRGVPGDQAPYTLETLHVDGARRGCVREAWGPPAPLREGWFSAEVEGLPGDPPVTLALRATLEGWFRRAEVVGRAGDLPAVARAWRDVLVAAACRSGRVDDNEPETRLMPEVWRARARRAETAALDGHVVDAPTAGAVWSIFPVDGVGFAVALEGDLPQVPDDVVGLRPRIVPIGPAPLEGARVDLRATRAEAAHDLAPRLFAAVTGVPLPEAAEVSRSDPVPVRRSGPDETQLILAEEQRFRAAPWTLLRVRRVGVNETLRLLHDQGRVVVQARTSDLGRTLDVSLLARPDDVAPPLAVVRAALEQGGWRL